jgi:hypothetical protein|tara:strand:- start:1003 stop:1194 length:192 start_codon:yes stop_codon:yes gene_type:complete
MGVDMKIGDLFRYINICDIHNIGVGSIGLIVGTPQRIEGFYQVIIGDKEYVLPFHHIEEVKCK